MNKYRKQERFMRVMMAMQAFAGKSMKSLDSAEVLADNEIYGMEAGLLSIAKRLRQEDTAQFADLHKLAEEIENRLRVKEEHGS